MITYAFDYIWFKIKTNKLWQEIIKWSATINVCVAATIITLYPESGLHPLPFSIFLFGHIIWSVFTFLIKEQALFALNMFFVALDGYGVIIRL